MDVSLRIVSRDSEPASFSISAHPQTRLPGDWKDMIESIASSYEVQIAIQNCWQYTTWQITSRRDLWDAGWGEPNYRCIEKKLPGIEKTLVFFDVSKNPGRFTPDTETPCHIAAEMWLGPGFWSYARCTKEEVLATDFFLDKRDTPHFLYLKSWPHPFTRPDGEQGRVQQKLWRLLYKQDCEWPPGSGGISDVPVGGPPELMP